MAKKEGLREYYIITYSTRHLLKKDKVRFYYALKGRDGKTGIVKRCKIRQLGRTVLMVQARFEDDVEAFVKYWKCTYQKMQVWTK